MLLLSSTDYFQNKLFQNLSGTLLECQTVWIQIRTDVLSVLILVQTVFQGYQKMTKLPLVRNCFLCNILNLLNKASARSYEMNTV